MTREEAVKIMSRIWGPDPQHGLGTEYVDAFVTLGMLKLDEPKDEIEWKIGKARSIGGIKAREWGKVAHGLEVAGLKIVEK